MYRWAGRFNTAVSYNCKIAVVTISYFIILYKDPCGLAIQQFTYLVSISNGAWKVTYFKLRFETNSKVLLLRASATRFYYEPVLRTIATNQCDALLLRDCATW